MKEFCDELTCFQFLPCFHQDKRRCAICGGSMLGTHPKATVCVSADCRRQSVEKQRAKNVALRLEKKLNTPVAQTQDWMRFLAMTTPGLERWCREELVEKLGDCRVVVPANARGRVFFDCALTETTLPQLQQLLSVEKVIAVVWVSNTVPHDGLTWKCKPSRSKEEYKANQEQREIEIKNERDTVLLNLENEILEKGQWDAALELFVGWHKQLPTEVKFRASCERHGTHVFKSNEVAGAVGGAAIRKYQWHVDLTDFLLDVFVYVVDNELVCGLTLLGDQQMIHRFRAPLLPGFVPITSLKPSTAYAMVKMAQIQPGEVCCDPFAGVGTIPIEASVSSSSLPAHSFFGLGGDLARDSLRQAQENQRTTQQLRAGPVDWLNWDVQCFPLRAGCLDVIITDMPFGLRHGKYTMMAPLYQGFVRELPRVLSASNPNSRAYLLTICTNLLAHILQQTPELCVDSTVECLIGGLQAKIFCVKRTRVTS